MTQSRTFIWQLGVIAAAAGLIGVAQAQSDQSAPAGSAEESKTVLEQYEANAASRNGLDQASDKTMDASTETRADTSTAAAPAEPATTSSDTSTMTPAVTTTVAPPAQDQTIVVVPTTVDQAAIAAKAWTFVEELPTTREDVVSEAVYANKNGLIAKGELSAKNEDKGSSYVEQNDQARIERSTQMYMAKVDAKHQELAAAEQARLNQLALQEQQRQQQLAAQQQQMAQQQPQQQPTQ